MTVRPLPLPAPAADRAAAAGWALPPQRSLPELVADRIVEAIRSGELKPGERIVELKLATRLGVSRGPLREALKVLAAKHVVESRRGRGTFVSAVADDDLLSMVLLRANLEGFAARFVAAGMSGEIADRLGELLRIGAAAARDGRTSDWREADWRFHETVVALAGNPFLLASWRSIGDLVRLFLHTHRVFEVEVAATLANHDRLYAALVSGDPDRAETAFRTVILRSAYRRFGREVPAALENAAARAADPPPEPAEAAGRAGRRARGG